MKKFKPGQSVVVLLFGNKYLGTVSTQDLYNNYSDMVLVDIELSEDECETINVYIQQIYHACQRCYGTGQIDLGGMEIKCTNCNGKGFLGE